MENKIESTPSGDQSYTELYKELQELGPEHLSAERRFNEASVAVRSFEQFMFGKSLDHIAKDKWPEALEHHKKLAQEFHEALGELKPLAEKRQTIDAKMDELI